MGTHNKTQTSRTKTMRNVKVKQECRPFLFQSQVAHLQCDIISNWTIYWQKLLFLRRFQNI